MKHKTLFRLLLRLMGVYFFFLGATALPSTIFGVWGLLSELPTSQRMSFARALVWHLSPVLQVAVGLYLFFGGGWIVSKAIPSNKPYCHECGYPIDGVRGERCPECDTPFRAEPASDAGDATA